MGKIWGEIWREIWAPIRSSFYKEHVPLFLYAFSKHSFVQHQRNLESRTCF